jgi:hypothetical protein
MLYERSSCGKLLSAKSQRAALRSPLRMFTLYDSPSS